MTIMDIGLKYKISPYDFKAFIKENKLKYKEGIFEDYVDDVLVEEYVNLYIADRHIDIRRIKEPQIANNTGYSYNNNYPQQKKSKGPGCGLIIACIIGAFLLFGFIALISAAVTEGRNKKVEPSPTFIEALKANESDSNEYHIINTYNSINESINNKWADFNDNSELLYYNQLSETEKTIYRSIDYSINNYDYLVIDVENTEFSNILYLHQYETEEAERKATSFYNSVYRAETAYHYDNPEVYWAFYTEYKDIVNNYYIGEFKYYFSDKESGYTEEELNTFIKRKNKFDAKLAKMEEKIKTKTAGMEGDWDKALYISKWLCNKLEYNEKLTDETDSNTSVIKGGIYFAVMKNTCVCRGYTQLYKYLLDSVGIQNQQCSGIFEEPVYSDDSEDDDSGIIGYAKDSEGNIVKEYDISDLLPEYEYTLPENFSLNPTDEIEIDNDSNHIWNVAKINGKLCNIDVTNMDSGWGKRVKYNFVYFGASDEELEETHTKSDYFTHAKCTSKKNSFFRHEKLFSKEITSDSIDYAIKYAIEHDYKYACVQYKKSGDAEKAYKKYVKDSLVLQNTLLKYNRQYDDIITVDEEDGYYTNIDSNNGIFYMIL